MRELVVVALLLAGCGGRVDQETQSSADVAEVEETIAPDTSVVIDTAPDVAPETFDARETATPCDAGGSLVAQCANGIDDDGDGLIDWLDPECLSPYDDDESAFRLGMLHEFEEPCKRDCPFDPNFGSGDDGWLFDARCLTGSINPRCSYDPTAAADPTRCPAPSEKCVSYCGARTPNGCDCTGCCDVFDATGTSKRVRVSSDSGCTLEKLGDPTACPPCEKRAACDRPCGPCDYCLGKTKLPADCTDDMKTACPAGSTRCDPGTPCPCGEFCLTGCCLRR